MEKLENPVFFQHLSGFAHRHFSLGVGKVLVLENLVRRTPKTKESGSGSTPRGLKKDPQRRIPGNAILSPTGLFEFSILVVKPSAFPRNAEESEIMFILGGGWCRSAPADRLSYDMKTNIQSK